MADCLVLVISYTDPSNFLASVFFQYGLRLPNEMVPPNTAKFGRRISSFTACDERLSSLVIIDPGGKSRDSPWTSVTVNSPMNVFFRASWAIMCTLHCAECRCCQSQRSAGVSVDRVNHVCGLRTRLPVDWIRNTWRPMGCK